MISDVNKQGIVWNDIKIGNKIYMISIKRRNGTVEVFLTDLIEIWLQTLTNEHILDRCRKLNPLLNVDALNCNEIVINMLNDISKHIVEASVEQIKLRAELQGGWIKFVLDFVKGTPQNFWEIITKPLCISSMEIIRQKKILLDLVQRKDEEITEYKAEGAELIRKNIETETFKEEQLKIDIPVPNQIDCAHAFQAMVKFYNALSLHEHNEASTKPTSSTSINNEIMQTEQNNHDEGTSGFKETVDEDISVQRKPKTSKSKNKSQIKNTSDEVIRNRIKTINMIHKPMKKLKTNFNEFI